MENNYGFLPSSYTPSGVEDNASFWTKFDDTLGQLPIIGSLTGATNRYNNRLNWYATQQAQKFQQNSANTSMLFESSEAQKMRDFNSAQAMLSREFNAKEAQKQRDYAREMSNTEIQRKMADMAAAGLNPILAYQNVSGNTPNSYAASSSAASGGTSPSGRAASSSAASLAAVDKGFELVKAAIPFLFMFFKSGKTSSSSKELAKIASLAKTASSSAKKYDTNDWDTL